MRILSALVLLVLASTVLACGSGEAPAPSPEQAAVFAEPVDQEIVIEAAPNAMRYVQTRVEARAGSRVRLVMDNSATGSPAMVHNVVVLAGEDAINRVGQAAAREADHLPDDPAILAATPLARPRERTAIVFTVPDAGEYPFICTYPGHFTMMRGVLVAMP